MTHHSSDIPSTPLRFIFFSLKPYWKRIVLIAVVVFLSQLFGEFTTYAVRGFIDTANAYSVEGGSVQTILFWALALPALSFLSALMIRTTGFLLNYVTVRARTATIHTLFKYTSLHSTAYFSDRFSGSLSSRVSTVSQNVSRLLNQFVWSILITFFSILVAFGLIANTNVKLAVAFAAGILILIPINLAITRKQVALSKKMAETLAKLRGQVVDVFSNITAVQQYARREHEIERLGKTIEEHRVADTTSDNFRERVLLLNNIIISVFIGGIIFWSFRIWIAGSLTVGEFIMIAAIVRSLLWMLTHIGQNLNNIMESYGEVKDGLEEIIVPHDIIDAPDATALRVTKADVVFKNVSFSYENNNAIFRNLSLSIPEKQKVGIVGTSGAGKTTLMKLLFRQYDLSSGAILISSTNITDVTQESLRDIIAIVPQEPILFHRTIKENILYGKLDATDEEMIEVAKKAKAHEFIQELPEGYDSLVGERGIKLSVGQRQRIAIARAFLKNAPILVLDEATSALDSESEVAVQTALHNLMEGKTVLAIAHRLSTLREMDRIIVFEDGDIVEDGAHKDLVEKKGGVYASLWKHQAGGFIEKDTS